MFADPEIIIFRDYINQIYLEERTKTTIDQIKLLRAGFDHLLPIVSQTSSDKLINIDTSNITEMETSILIADNIIDGMTRKLKMK